MAREETVKAIFKALDLLEYLGTAKVEMGCLEIARNLKIPSSTIYRLLNTLEIRGYVKQNKKTEGYSLGPKVLDLQDAIAKNTDLKNVAYPYMARLAELSRESCNLGVLDGKEILHIQRVESPEVLRANIRSFRLPAHTTAIGMVLMAHSSKAELAKLLQEPLQPSTQYTITDKEKLCSKLEEIRIQKFAVDNEEGFIGVRSIAVPIHNHLGQVIAGLSLLGPTERLTPEKLIICKKLLISTADDISKDI